MAYLVLDTRQGGAFVLADSPAGPVITSATPSPFNVASTLTIIISEEVPEGDVFLRYSSYEIAQTHSSWVAAGGETTITVPVTVGGLPFVGNLVVRVTPDAMGDIDAATAIAPPSGSAAVVIASPSFEIGSVLRDYTGNTPANGWQMEHNDHPNTTLNPDGTFTQIVQRDFQVRVWDASDNTRGAWGSAFTAAGIVDVNGGEPLVAGEPFTVTVSKINANDVAYLRIRQGSALRWDVEIDEIESETEMVFIAPDDLPAGTLSLEVLESRGAKNIRGIIDAFQVSVDEIIADAEGFKDAAEAALAAINYEQIDVNLDGDFSSGSIRLVRIGGTVSVFSITTLNHSSSSLPQSSQGLIPAGFRPPSSIDFKFIDANASARLQLSVSIWSSGRFSMGYADLDTGAPINRTSPGGFAGFTYLLA